MEKTKRILAAVRERDADLVSAVLGGYFDFTLTHTLRAAEAAIDEQIGLIVCGVHFDQGSMFELLRIAKAHPVGRGIPFFLVLREETSHPQSVIKGIKGAATLLGADAFIDLGELRTHMDTQEIFDHLRGLVRAALFGG